MASVDGFQVPSDDDYDALYQIFNQYCWCVLDLIMLFVVAKTGTWFISLGTAREVDEMDNIKFVRFCRDLGIIAHAGGGAGLHVTDVDLLFVTIKPRVSPATPRIESDNVWVFCLPRVCVQGRKKLTFDNFCDAVAVMADKLGVTRTDLIRQVRPHPPGATSSARCDLIRQAIAMDLPQPALTSATRHSMTLSHHVSSSLLASHHTLSSAHSRRLSLPHPAAGHAASAHAASAHVASAHAGYTHAASAHAAPASPAALAPLAAHTSYPLREGRGGRPAAGGASGSAGGFGGGGGGAGDIVPPGDDFPPRLRLIRTRSLEAEEHTRTAAGGFDACRPEPLSELRSSLSDHNSHEGRAMGGREKGERGAEGGQQVGGNGAGRGAGERNENSQGGELYAQRQAVAGGRNNEALGYLHGGEEVVARGGYAQGIANDNDGDSSGVGWTDGAMGRVVVSAVAAAAEESRQGRRGQAGGVVGGGAQQYDDDGNSSTGGRLSNEDPAAAAAEGAVASLMFFDAFRFFSLPHFARHHFVPLAQCGRHQLQGLPPPRMDSIRFIKMCKETAILDARFTTTSADIIFSKVTRGSERKLSVYTLAAALRLIEAEKGLAPPALERIIIAHFLAHFCSNYSLAFSFVSNSCATTFQGEMFGVGRRLAVRLLVGGMDGASGTEQSSDGREVWERRAQRVGVHKSASEANIRGAALRGGFVLADSMGALAGADSGKWVNGGSAMFEAQRSAEQEELAYLGMEAERIQRSGVIDIVNDDDCSGGGSGSGGGGGGGGSGGFPKHLSWNYRGLDITPKGSSRAQAGGDRDSGVGVEAVLASWAQERRELEGQVGALKAELKRKERELKAAGKGKAAAGREVDAVWGQVSALEAQLQEVQGDKSALEKEIEGLRALHVSRARESGDGAGGRAADVEMAGMLKMVGDFSRRLALADDAVRRAEAKNDDLSERLKASEAELRGTREALRTAQEDRDALAAEMKEALDTWAWTGCAHPAPAAATPGRGGSSGSGAMGMGASSTSAWKGLPWAEHTGQGMARNGIPSVDDGRDGMQQWQQRVRDIAGASQWGRGGYGAGGGVSRPPRDLKMRPGAV
ncbi:unnamed protein product [Closterium sp. Yama58-4]|nr:unnamed protein product [Closterium sp. Yama58-4]